MITKKQLMEEARRVFGRGAHVATHASLLVEGWQAAAVYIPSSFAGTVSNCWLEYNAQSDALARDQLLRVLKACHGECFRGGTTTEAQMTTGKVTKQALVDEAKRVFGPMATVRLDVQFMDIGAGLFWSSAAVGLHGVELSATASHRSTASRRLYAALRALAPAVQGIDVIPYKHACTGACCSPRALGLP